MPRRRQINANPGGRRARAPFAAATARIRDLGGAVEEHVVWRVADLLRGIAEVVRWPFERLAWALERRLIWPLQERVAGSEVPGRAVGAGALAAVAVGAVAFGAVWASGGESDGEPVAAPSPVAAAAPAPAPPAAEAEPAEPALQGVPPKFGLEDGVGVASAGDDGSGGDLAGDSLAGTDGASAAGEEGAATASSQKPVPAGPEAMKVARRFTEAFVFYEVGERPAQAVAVFEATATPRLAAALAERPPRLPKGTEVPKARVLNLVPGPRSGKAYTVSASLLRVGVTSELRMKMATREGAWLITDVRG